MCDLKPSLAWCWNSLVVFEEHRDAFLSWLSGASLITQPSLETAGKETNNKSPRFGVALWLHLQLCWFYKLLKFEKCQHRGFFAIFSFLIPHPRVKNLHGKCLAKTYKTPATLRPKLNLPRRMFRFMVLFSAVKLRGVLCC